MKKSILMLMVAGLFAAMPVSAEKKMMSAEEQIQHCALQSESIDKKIERLQKDVKAGKMKKLSAEELQKLEAKLNEANYMLDSLTKP